MRILLVNNLYPPNRVGGAERSVQLLAEGLRQNGHKPVVVTIQPEGEQSTKRFEEVRVHRLPLRNRYWPFDGQDRSSLSSTLWYLADAFNVAAGRDLAGILESENPDLVHTHNLLGFSPYAWKALGGRGIPLVHTLRDYYLLCLRSTLFRNNRRCESRCMDCRILKQTSGWFSKSVDGFIGISSHVIDRHREAGLVTDHHVTSVIPNPVSDRSESPDDGNNSSSDPETLRLGYLGQIKPNKGLEWLLETLNSLDTIDWELRVGGEVGSDYANNLRQQYESEQVTFLGYVDPTEFYRRIDLLVVPSLWEEPMGRVVIEAYDHGVPVLTSDRGGLPEIVDEGHTGYSYDPDDPADFEEKLEEIHQGDRLGDLESNLPEVSEKYALDRHVTAHEDFYDSIMSS